MLEAVDLVYSYPGRDTALRGINATFPRGLTLLAGANASGKSTLLRIFSGLATPDSGKVVQSDGSPLSPDALRSLSRLVIQDADLQILGASVGEDIALGRSASNLGGQFDAEAVRLAKSFGLEHLWQASVEVLSYGQKRKLSLVNALLAGPKLLLLDEPFEALDYPSAQELRGFIAANSKAGIDQIVSTHDLEPLFDLADWLVVVRDGAVAGEGKPGDLLPHLREWSVRMPGGSWN